jgi:Ser/Thr protein kinase RdoA (MazF antagonist)
MYLLDNGYCTVAAVRSRHGNWIETISTKHGHYHGVVFEQAKGVHISIDQMMDYHFEEWGKSLASLHLLSESYTPNFTSRKSWVDTFNFILTVLKRHPQEHEALKEYERIKAWLSELPSGKEVSRYSAIDFDDSIYYWFMMDITNALSDKSLKRLQQPVAATMHQQTWKENVGVTLHPICPTL